MKYKVLNPIGKKEPGPGYRVGAVIQDGDLPAETITAFLNAGWLEKIPAKQARKKKEVNNG